MKGLKKLKTIISPRLLLHLYSFIALPLAVIWMIVEPGIEPILAFLSAVIAYVSSFAVSNEPFGDQHTLETKSSRYARNRQITLQNVKTTWIDGFLKNALHKAVYLELDLQLRPDAVTRIFRQPGRLDYKIPPGTPIIDVFHQHGNALLILGSPGAGKTISLLELARDLIEQAEKDNSHPLPLVFNLSSWAEKRLPLSEWLIEELLLQYQVSPKIGRTWVETDQISLLLDGLDEVRSDYRNDCVKVINEFRKEHMIDLVVCSRASDYESLNTQLNLPNAILIQPLTEEQIEAYLGSDNLGMQAVKHTLKHDKALQELASSPLMLSVMALAYRGLRVNELGPLSTTQLRRHHLFNTYIQRMFEHRPGNLIHPQKAIQWLSWIGYQMSKRAQIILHIEKLQPDWIPNTRDKWKYATLTGLITVPIVILLVWLCFSAFIFSLDVIISILAERSATRIGLGIIVVLVGGLLAGLTYGIGFGLEAYNSKIKLVEALDWSTGKAVLALLLTLITGLIGGRISSVIGQEHGWFTGGIFFGILVGFTYWLLRRKKYSFTLIAVRCLAVGIAGAVLFGFIAWLIDDFIDGSLIGLIAGLGYGLLGGLFGSLVFSLESREIEQKLTPNQGIYRSAKNALRVALGSGILGIVAGMLVAAIFFTIGDGKIGELLVAVITKVTGTAHQTTSAFLIFLMVSTIIVGALGFLIVGPIGAMRFGGRPCIWHFAVRAMLVHYDYLPFNLVGFLDDMTERILLHKVGGGYIFIHRMLQEHFATLRKGILLAETRSNEDSLKNPSLENYTFLEQQLGQEARILSENQERKRIKSDLTGDEAFTIRLTLAQIRTLESRTPVIWVKQELRISAELIKCTDKRVKIRLLNNDDPPEFRWVAARNLRFPPLTV